MGYDIECVPNVQLLAREYFCPVCRQLVCPNEALQAFCTHLYCKPCLAYIVSSSRVCPYDGCLVMETDAKPLMEINKALADTIGKIMVHCLYQKSGCTWMAPLSKSSSHCSSCVFGRSQAPEHARVFHGIQQVRIRESLGSHPIGGDQSQASAHAEAVATPNLKQLYQQEYQQYYQGYSYQQQPLQHRPTSTGMPSHGYRPLDNRPVNRFFYSSFGRELAARGNFQFRMGEQLHGRGIMMGQGVIPSHIQGGDQFGPHGLPVTSRWEEQSGSSGIPRRPGDPVISRDSLQGSFPSMGDDEPSGTSKRQKVGTAGWCGICNVDCESMEGLELHGETKDHREKCMDMALMMKQDATKDKQHGSFNFLTGFV